MATLNRTEVLAIRLYGTLCIAVGFALGWLLHVVLQ